jgi:hypothetical protein
MSVNEVVQNERTETLLCQLLNNMRADIPGSARDKDVFHKSVDRKQSPESFLHHSICLEWLIRNFREAAPSDQIQRTFRSSQPVPSDSLAVPQLTEAQTFRLPPSSRSG